MKIGMHIILCVHKVWLQMHPCLKGNLCEAWACAFSLIVFMLPMTKGFLHVFQQGLHVPYDTLECI